MTFADSYTNKMRGCDAGLTSASTPFLTFSACSCLLKQQWTSEVQRFSVSGLLHWISTICQMCFENALSDSRLRRDVIHITHTAAAAGLCWSSKQASITSTAHTNACRRQVSGDDKQFTLGFSQTTPYYTLSLHTSTLFARRCRGSRHIKCHLKPISGEWKWVIKPSNSRSTSMLTYWPRAMPCYVRQGWRSVQM